MATSKQSFPVIIAIGAVSALLAVAIGAFGAHGLEPYLKKIGRADTFETAARYQMYHSLALVGIGILIEVWRGQDARVKPLRMAGYWMLFGILVFSGSLYILCLTDVPKWGMVTPLGGLGFMGGWLMVLLACLKKEKA